MLTPTGAIEQQVQGADRADVREDRAIVELEAELKSLDEAIEELKVVE